MILSRSFSDHHLRCGPGFQYFQSDHVLFPPLTNISQGQKITILTLADQSGLQGVLDLSPGLYLLYFRIMGVNVRRMHLESHETGYPHDGRADKDSYPHDGRADKDSYPHVRDNQYIMLSL